MLAQTWQAYTMSTLVLEPDFALAFAVLVGATAFAVPACLLLPSPLMRTTSWWRSSCSPLSFHCVYMVLPTLASYFASKVYLCVLFSNEDFVVSVYSARQVAVSASKDILIKLCPIVAMMQTMRNLIRCFGAAPPVSHALKLKKLPTMSTITETGELTTSSLATSILSSHTAALALGSFKRQSRSSQRSSKAIQVSFTKIPPPHLKGPMALPMFVHPMSQQGMPNRCAPHNVALWFATSNISTLANPTHRLVHARSRVATKLDHDQLWISQFPLTTLPSLIASLELLYGLRLNTNMLHDVHTRHVPNHADPAVVEQTRGRDRRHKQPHRAHASGCVGDSPSDALRIV
ncbi:hypothetical protein H257_06629 [Aphanomyces astaci]|uniref:Uncharacterized protein n=1 Tax=Aphanomyces astaci TaxID=112090 RepID=W4GN16_APHAT|nr:hypothetical protein H257_06629 [Aphanomyces astaci]ETV80298.1 hypothetical protein H257_06629 [Aphanomyces astaci]|eukprot:XP_009830222.1 hypothetical protein H257_06629 [Aphanomyces astaci]